MRRGLWFVVCAVVLGQVEPRDPFDRAMQLSQEARTRGNPAEAANQREEARKLLEQIPAGSQQWAGRVQNLAQSYRGSGRNAQARAVLEQALARANTLPEWHPARIQLLNTLADLWHQDGNWLKALSYREKAVAAFEAMPPGASVEAPAGPMAKTVQGNLVTGVAGSRPGFRASGPGNNAYLYDQLANLSRELGRPEAAAKALAKMRALAQNNPGLLADSYVREGNLNEALEIYQKQAAETAAKPQAQVWEIVSPSQAMASLYERQQRWPEAIAALQQAGARLDGSGDPTAANQAAHLRLRIATFFQRSGQTQAAEQLYQTVINQAANGRDGVYVQALREYADYLADSGRGAQGSRMLTDYLTGHPDLQPWQQANLLMALSQMARKAGDKDLADQYQQAATEKQRAAQPAQPARGPVIASKIQTAQRAVSEGKLDEALNLGLEAIASAAGAPDGDLAAWQAPNLAAQLAARQAPDKGEQIYRALFPLLEDRAADNLGPLTQALQLYARFLMGQNDRLGDAALAIDRYREIAVAAEGAETDAMIQVQRLRLELADRQGAREEAARRAEELLAIEESLSGANSTRYMNAAQTAARVYQAAGDMDRALALQRELVAIADRTLTADNPQRGFLRMNAAMAFAAARQFDDAERLANEAIAISDRLPPAQANILRKQAEQIQRMKANGGSGPTPPGARGFTPVQMQRLGAAPQP